MKPSGSSSRRQRSPTSRRSTCSDRASGGQSGGPGRSWSPSCYSPTSCVGTGVRVRPDSRVEECGERAQGRAGRSTCWRGDLSAERPGLSVEDMVARRARGAARGLGCLAGGLRAPRWGWGLLARGRRPAGIQAGAGSRGRGCSRSPRPRQPLCPPAAESPRVRFKLLSNSQAKLAGGSRGACSRPFSPLAPLSGRLKGIRGLRGQFGRERAQVLCQKPPGPSERGAQQSRERSCSTAGRSRNPAWPGALRRAGA